MTRINRLNSNTISFSKSNNFYIRIAVGRNSLHSICSNPIAKIFCKVVFSWCSEGGYYSSLSTLFRSYFPRLKRNSTQSKEGSAKQTVKPLADIQLRENIFFKSIWYLVPVNRELILLSIKNFQLNKSWEKKSHYTMLAHWENVDWDLANKLEDNLSKIFLRWLQFFWIWNSLSNRRRNYFWGVSCLINFLPSGLLICFSFRISSVLFDITPVQ